MDTFIPSKQELESIVSRCVKKAIKEILPTAIQKGTRKQWLRTDEVMQMLQCSRRHVQYLRDSGQLAFTQNARTIRYHVNDVEAFLNRTKVELEIKESRER